ncbi:unnamed protein product [Haemonchus placei]|uniref:Headcase domain-containing protein n=1 Tax=Haemonchus placei TaxID=6290 RepID=A0A158QL21_HAEPC|nr:unnamed protein product [Haemonchus placei]
MEMHLVSIRQLHTLTLQYRLIPRSRETIQDQEVLWPTAKPWYIVPYRNRLLVVVVVRLHVVVVTPAAAGRVHDVLPGHASGRRLAPPTPPTVVVVRSRRSDFHHHRAAADYCFCCRRPCIEDTDDVMIDCGSVFRDRKKSCGEFNLIARTMQISTSQRKSLWLLDEKCKQSVNVSLNDNNSSNFVFCSDSDEFRRRSGSSRSDGKRWGRKDTGGGELRCCIQPDILRSNVDKHWFFEDEQVRINGSVFARRENFDNLLSIIPMSKFNGIHIKMEDDCPQGGDDVRLCLLKTLGAHNQRVVPCVGCHRDMIVYDRYPLVDGVFFLSPVCHFGPPTEVCCYYRSFADNFYIYLVNTA